VKILGKTLKRKYAAHRQEAKALARTQREKKGHIAVSRLSPSRIECTIIQIRRGGQQLKEAPKSRGHGQRRRRANTKFGKRAAKRNKPARSPGRGKLVVRMASGIDEIRGSIYKAIASGI